MLDGTSPQARVASVKLEGQERSLTIALEDGTQLEMAPDAPEARGITPGLLLSPELVAGLERAGERKRIARKLFGWLDRRPRCRADLNTRLLAAGFEADASTQVLDGFEKTGLVDDAAYAETWARDQLRRKPVGRFWLLARLRQEGVGREDAENAVNALLSAEDELEGARRALERKKLDLSEERQRAKALRFLQSRGFSRAVSAAALRSERAKQDELRGDDES